LIHFTVDVGPEPAAQSESEEGDQDDNDEGGDDEEGDDDEDGEDDEDDDDDDDEAEFEDDGDDVVTKKSGRSSVTGSPNSSGNFAATALDARAKLAANLLLLTGPELGHVVSRLEQLCPAALEILPKDSVMTVTASNARPDTAIPGKMEIVLDLIDAPLLKELSDYSVKATAQRKRGRAIAEAEKAANVANTKEKHTAAVAAAAAAAAAAGSTENNTSASQPQVPGPQGGADAATAVGMDIDDMNNKRKRKK
jgi:hypothetical protein